ncbi:MAG: hypothetical protein Q8K58_13560 [Acidimicrobiales bacterium]|nr:hypothetical protein [Acidimicrobiales bacterium]
MTDEVEDRIREYLKALGRKPPKAKPVIDREAVDALRKRIAESDDPIEKLKLHTELEQVRRPRIVDTPDPRVELESYFVEHAKVWADENQISAASFAALKVPRDVLRRAGIALAEGVEPGRRTVGGRSARVPLEDVLATMNDLPRTWSLKTLAGALDRDVATARNYVRRLVEDGAVEEVGEDSSHQGRPSKVYALTRP